MYQNDPRWKSKQLGRSNVTIGTHGCLLTSLVNIYNQRYNEAMTPAELNDQMNVMAGFTSGGLIIWDIASKILQADIKPHFAGDIVYDSRTFYIVNFISGGIGHFSNLIEKSNDKYFIYDVWNGLNIIRDHSEIRRVVRVSY